jgi:hypothetical protein
MGHLDRVVHRDFQKIFAPLGRIRDQLNITESPERSDRAFFRHPVWKPKGSSRKKPLPPTAHGFRMAIKSNCVQLIWDHVDMGRPRRSNHIVDGNVGVHAMSRKSHITHPERWIAARAIEGSNRVRILLWCRNISRKVSYSIDFIHFIKCSRNRYHA